jgi:YVTN family beta-propeller protein
MKRSINITIAFVMGAYVFALAQDISTAHVGAQKDGSYVVPTHQIIRPAGLQIPLPGRPNDLALSPDEKMLAVKNWKSLDLIRIRDRVVLQSLPYPKSGAAVTGLAWSGDGRKIFVSEAQDRVRVAELDLNNVMRWGESIVMPRLDAEAIVKVRADVGETISGDPAPGGLALSKDGKRLFVTLSRYNVLAAVDLPYSRVRTAATGMAPYDIALADQKIYVTNWGGRRPQPGEAVANSSASKILVDPVTGIASSGSVSVLEAGNLREVKSIEVGLHPAGMALSPDQSFLYVACANSDIISVIDTRTDQVCATIPVRMQDSLPFGSAPNALAVSPDGALLYVANGADNAICCIRLGVNAGGPAQQSRIEGYIPTGWYPGSVILDGKGENLFVANVKGFGSLNALTDRNGHNSHDHLGSVSIIKVPDEKKLADYSAQVRENTLLAKKQEQIALMLDKAKSTGAADLKKVPVPTLPGEISVFKHVLYIIKENRTYDQVFGDLKQGNGDTSLVMFGREVTPNHHSLAETFVLLDNFNCSGVLSADGHQWTDEAYATDYIEKTFGDWVRSYPYDGDDALAYASSGFIWDNVLRHGLTFRDYGEFVNADIAPKDATFMDVYNDYRNGTRKVKIQPKPNLETLRPYVCPTYIGFPATMPDVYRAQEFIKELRQYEKKNNLPNFMIMLLPNDHTSGTRPGRPTPRASVADNDLALGQIVETISKSKFWPETCILVTEDDPQAGLDHVDGHRTVGLVISPYTKRGQVISTLYSQISMVRTIESMLGLPPMNQLDLAADPMIDCFSEKADFTPYTALPNNVPLDELNPPLTSLRGDALYWAEKSLAMDLSDVDKIDEGVFNRIIWHAVKGYKVPYPGDGD